MKRFAVVLLLLAGSLSYANDSKLSPDLKSSTASTVRVVVQYNQAPGLLDLNLLGTLGSILNSLPLVNGVVADLPLVNVLTLSNQADVKYISLDRVLAPNLSNAAPAINAFGAWQSGYTGAGIGVALLDSGVSSHPDMNGGFLGLSRVVYNQSFVSGNASAADQYGHGTHVAGLIAGDGASSTGSKYSRTFEGIAPGAQLVNLRVLDQHGDHPEAAVQYPSNESLAGSRGVRNLQARPALPSRRSGVEERNRGCGVGGK